MEHTEELTLNLSDIREAVDFINSTEYDEEEKRQQREEIVAKLAKFILAASHRMRTTEEETETQT